MWHQKTFNDFFGKQLLASYFWVRWQCTTNWVCSGVLYRLDFFYSFDKFSFTYKLDLDECATRNGGCEHDCTNTLGGFQCFCRTGFTLHENQKSCIVGDCVHEIFTTLDTPLLVGYISSPNYPKHYPASKDCAWLIKTSPGHRIRLVFLIFNLESHPECYHDSVQVCKYFVNLWYLILKFLQIYDGDSSKAHEAGRYCGAEVPQPIDSTENQLYMTFKSDVNVHKKGFLATYYTVSH